MKRLVNYKIVMLNLFQHLLATAVFLFLFLSAYSNAQFKLPKYDVLTLDNGLTIYLMEKKDVPIISFSAVFDAGVIRDGEKKGLASFTAEALKFGTSNYSKIQIDSIFNFYGSSLNTYARLDYSGLYAQFMKDDLDKLLPVIKEVMTTPTFPEEEIVKRKQRWIAELDQAKESPGRVIGAYFNRFLFTNSIYANPVDGTKLGIESITSDDIKQFYKKNYPLKYSAIAIVGDFDTDQMKNKIISYLMPGSFLVNKSDSIRTKDKIEYFDIDRLPVYTLHDDSVLTVPGTKDTRFKKGDSNVYLINKDNATETTFMIGGFGVPMNNQDKIQIDVINTILGGRFTAWLIEELRTNAGLTYSAWSRFASYKGTGAFYISTFTQTENTEQAIDLALKTYNRLFEKGIDEATLKSARNYVKGQFPPGYETASSLAGFLTQKYIYGFEDSYINDFEKAVDGMTVESANEIIRKYFPKYNLQFVLIGKADDIREIVKKYGKVFEKNIDEDGF